MNVKIDKQNSDAYIFNIAFIKAIFIKEYIMQMPITKDEKEKILKATVQFLKDN